MLVIKKKSEKIRKECKKKAEFFGVQLKSSGNYKINKEDLFENGSNKTFSLFLFFIHSPSSFLFNLNCDFFSCSYSAVCAFYWILRRILFALQSSSLKEFLFVCAAFIEIQPQKKKANDQKQQQKQFECKKWKKKQIKNK